MPTRGDGRASPWLDAILALSLANLLFLQGWIELLEGVKHPLYRSHSRLYWVDCAGVMLDVLLLAGLVVLVFRLGKRFWVRTAPSLYQLVLLAGFFFALLTVVDVMGQFMFEIYIQPFSWPGGSAWIDAAEATGALALAGLLFRWRKVMTKVASVALLVFSPFVLITFGQAIWVGLGDWATELRANTVSNHGELPHAQSKQRALWIIFDDLDYRLAFVDRPAGVALPEFDRLRGESLFATRAQSPGKFTPRAMSSMISGRRVARATPASASELTLVFENGSRSVGWSTQPSVFSRAREAGLRSAVIGWHLPYCRVFKETLAACWWTPLRADQPDKSVLKAMTESAFRVASPFVPRVVRDRIRKGMPASDKRHHIDTYERILAQARQAIGNPDFDLILVHMPVPHGPYIYDRVRGEFSLGADERFGYVDNLVLADKALGALRRELDDTGLAATTALLVGSDHPERKAYLVDGKTDTRVPFLFKLAEQSQSISYDRPLDTTLSGDLLLTVMQGELSDPESVARWLDARAGGD